MNRLLSKSVRYFIAVMDEKNISHAARNLHITRSPLGKAIVELEESIGSKLFIRKGNTLQPTEQAIHLYKQLKPVFESLLSIEDVFFYKKSPSQLRLFVDEAYPCNLFHGIKSLQYIKGLGIKVEKKTFAESTILSVLSDPYAAFLTLSPVSLYEAKTHSVMTCALKKIYFLYANNKVNNNKNIKDIIYDSVVVKSGSIPQKQLSDCLSLFQHEKSAAHSIINDDIDLPSMLNLIRCNEAVSFVSEGFLRFCNDDISSVVMRDITITPRILCADNSLRHFEPIIEFINN